MNKNFNIETSKFSFCIMNPPYDGNLHLRFLEKSTEISNKVISIQPAEWCIRPYIKNGWKNIKEKLKNSIGEKIEDLEILKNNPFDAGIAVMLGIFVLGNNGNIDYYNELSNNDNKYLNYLTKFNTGISLKDKIVKYNKNIKYFCPLRKDAIFERWWTLQLINYLDVIVNNKIYSGDYKGLTISEAREKNPHENQRNNNRDTLGIEFNTLDELINFRNSVKLEAYLFIIALLKTARSNPFDKLPYLLDYTKVWTNDKIFDLFNIKKEYRNTIINLMKPFMKPYKNFGNLLNITKEKLNNINLFNE